VLITSKFNAIKDDINYPFALYSITIGEQVKSGLKGWLLPYHSIINKNNLNPFELSIMLIRMITWFAAKAVFTGWGQLYIIFQVPFGSILQNPEYTCMGS